MIASLLGDYIGEIDNPGCQEAWEEGGNKYRSHIIRSVCIDLVADLMTYCDHFRVDFDDVMDGAEEIFAERQKEE
jgi:hypothetical protein